MQFGPGGPFVVSRHDGRDAHSAGGDAGLERVEPAGGVCVDAGGLGDDGVGEPDRRVLPHPRLGPERSGPSVRPRTGRGPLTGRAFTCRAAV